MPTSTCCQVQTDKPDTILDWFYFIYLQFVLFNYLLFGRPWKPVNSDHVCINFNLRSIDGTMCFEIKILHDMMTLLCISQWLCNYSGESGAGKTVNTKRVIQYFASIAAGSVKKDTGAKDKVCYKLWQRGKLLRCVKNQVSTLVTTVISNLSVRKFFKLWHWMKYHLIPPEAAKAALCSFQHRLQIE